MESRTINGVKVEWKNTAFVRQDGAILYFTDGTGGSTDFANTATNEVQCTRGVLRVVSPNLRQSAKASGRGRVYQSGGDMTITD